ncbi:class I SAM-dependent DNA methyltransferase, partial [Salmonella sp. s51228]|uniref:class I SAM-dependent DNA methyltransferase n=1 Tax=Salmonella sp. s51228 TaxID=3159652 RepID=UPI0039808B95
DFLDDIGWQASAIGAKILQKELEHRNVPKDASIIDIGAGTGLVGLELNKFGYTNLSAIDISYGMLDEAKNKKVYSEFILANINTDINIESKNIPFDNGISIGLFFTGHAEPHGFENV